MGNCMNKLRESQTNTNINTNTNIDKTIGLIVPIQAAQNKIQQTLQNQQFQNNNLANKRQVRYWNRRIDKIIGINNNNSMNGNVNMNSMNVMNGNNMNMNGTTNNNTNPNNNNVQITQFHIYKFFNCTQLSKETLHNLYQYFKQDKINKINNKYNTYTYTNTYSGSSNNINSMNNINIKSNTLTKQKFIQILIKLVSTNDLQISAIIYQIYFSRTLNVQKQFQLFSQQFKPFIKQYTQQSNSINLKTSQTIGIIKDNAIKIKLKQLHMILQQRKNSYDRNKSIKWISNNINMHNFKLKFLQESVKIDQIQAYKLFWLDYSKYSSRLISRDSMIQDQSQKQVRILNWRWCQKMIKYFQQKYQTVGVAAKLRRRPTLQSQPIVQLRKNRKQSIEMNNSILNSNNTGNYHNSITGNDTPLLKNTRKLAVTRSSINQTKIQQSLLHENTNTNNMNNLSSINTINVKQKQIGSGYQFKYHPGQIDNYALIGNFQWELKRNIRKYVDYITVREQTLDKIILVFGGGPLIIRRVIQGYIELRPYFLNVYQFVYDTVTGMEKLFDDQLIRLYPSEYVSNISLNLQKLQNKKYVCYHRNIGVSWQKFQISTIPKNQKIMDQFSQTSFLIYMELNMQEYFKKLYLQPVPQVTQAPQRQQGTPQNIILSQTRITQQPQQPQPQKQSQIQLPTIGDMYQSSTYKIIQSIQTRTINTQKINICILSTQQKGFITFVVLNWSHHIHRKIPIKQFILHFKLINNQLSITTIDKKIRGGISNLGNTCYMNAALQGLFSCLKDQQLYNIKGQLALQLRQMKKYIVEKKKSVFPVDFKTTFDRRVEFFKGQDQHDVHQFFSALFEQIAIDNNSNNQTFNKLFQIQYQLTDRCKNCNKSLKNTLQNYIVELPLRDFTKKQVKIDYITQNKYIQTVIFEIQEQSTIQEWRKSFQRISGAKQYYMCQVQNSIITRTFNKQEIQLDKPYRQLQLQNQFLITAYQTLSYKTKLKFDKKKHDYRTYKSQKGTLHIARIQRNTNTNTNLNTNISQINQKQKQKQKQKQNKNKVYIKLQKGVQFQQKLVNQNQLLKFPQQYQAKQIYVKINNRDDLYNQNIGRPFIFKIKDTCPISAVRQALQNCIGNKGYFLRISPLNQHSKCQICGYYNHQSSKCFLEKQNLVPLCWINGILEFVAVWQDVDSYNNIVKRVKFVPQIKQTIQPQNYDNFDLSMKLLSQKQIVQASCQFCRNPKAQRQRFQEIIKWPPILVIHLERLFRNMNTAQICKNHTKWKLQNKLYVGNSKYVLKAVLCHIGTSAQYGHYVTVSNGVCYDDQLVTEMTYDKIRPEEIYMLFYTKGQ